MARYAFYSFHYKPDNWRASQVRNMGVIDGNKPANDNDWETITKGGDQKIKDWIADQMKGKSVVIVLIGKDTAGRKWINYEIEKAWNDKKGILGIYIHNLQDSDGNKASIGNNPFANVKVTINNVNYTLSSIVKTYLPISTDSKEVYAYIKKNLPDWIEEAIKIREKY